MSKRTEVESLINKAAKTNSADEAMKFSQAAVNAANALCALKSSERKDDVLIVDTGEIERIGGRAKNPDIDAALRILEINGLLNEDEMAHERVAETQ